MKGINVLDQNMTFAEGYVWIVILIKPLLERVDINPWVLGRCSQQTWEYNQPNPKNEIAAAAYNNIWANSNAHQNRPHGSPEPWTHGFNKGNRESSQNGLICHGDLGLPLWWGTFCSVGCHQPLRCWGQASFGRKDANHFRLVNYYDVPRYNDSYYEANHTNHISGLLQNIVDKW